MTTVVLILIILVVAVILWMVLRQNSSAHDVQTRRPVQPQPGTAAGGTQSRPAPAGGPGELQKLRGNKLFWGVQIRQPGCEAAKALVGRKFPFDEIPEFPVSQCTATACTCQFTGLVDHRKEERRTHSERRAELRFDQDQPDRRSHKDRRHGDTWKDRME